MRYGLKEFGEGALGVALDEFLAWPDEGISDQDLADHEPLFYPWFIFNWEYEADPDEPQLDGPEDTTIAELYTTHKGNRLNHLEAQIIKATARQPYSFYEIQETRPGTGYRLKDILRGTVSSVIEKRLGKHARYITTEIQSAGNPSSLSLNNSNKGTLGRASNRMLRSYDIL